MSVSGLVEIRLAPALPSLPVLTSSDHAALKNAVKLPGVDEGWSFGEGFWRELEFGVGRGQAAEEHRVHLTLLKSGCRKSGEA